MFNKYLILPEYPLLQAIVLIIQTIGVFVLVLDNYYLDMYWLQSLAYCLYMFVLNVLLLKNSIIDRNRKRTAHKSIETTALHQEL